MTEKLPSKNAPLLRAYPVATALQLRAENAKKIQNTMTRKKYSIVCPRGFEPDTYYIKTTSGVYKLISNQEEYNKYHFGSEIQKFYAKNT